MVRVSPNIGNYDGRERIELEEYFYHLQLLGRHCHSPDELEKLRMIKAGLLEPDGSEKNEEKEKEKPRKELEVV